jgi:chromosome segregation ATPase
MGAGLLAIDPAAEGRLEKARFEFEAAEAHWAQISSAIESDPEHSALLDQLEAVYLEAFDLLGGQEPDDLEAALRSHTEAKRDVTVDELVDALAYQLELVGLELGPSPSLDRTVVVAEAFLTETAGLTSRVEELEAERHHVGGALEEAEDELASLRDPDASQRANQSPPVTVEITADDVARLERELNEATEGEAEMRERLEARQTLVDAATQVHAVATSKLMRIAAELAEREPGANTAATDPGFEIPVDEVDDGSHEALEFYLLARLAGLRNVSFAGSVPLVVDDAFRDLPADELRPLLVKLEKMAEAVQVIYLTDDTTVTDWAFEVGFQRAAVVNAPALFR